MPLPLLSDNAAWPEQHHRSHERAMLRSGVVSSSQRVAIIGAGPSGCAAAYAHRLQGAEVTLYERNPAIGGRTFTHRADGDHLDTGAGFVTNFYPRLWSVADDLRFSDEIAELERLTGLSHDSHLATLDVGSILSLLRFPFVSLRDKLKMASWTAKLSLKRRALDIASAQSLAPYDNETISAHCQKHLGDDLYHFLVRPGIEPFWYFRCEDVSASLAIGLTAHAAGARFYHLQKGIDRICHHLSRGVNVRTHCHIERIAEADDTLVVSGQQEGRTFQQSFDRVVVATTATVANAITAELKAPWLSTAQRSFLQSQRYVPNVHIAFRVPRMAEAPKVNAIFPTGPGRAPIAALSFHYFKTDPKRQKSHELISVFFATEESARIMNDSDEQIRARALELAKELYPALPDDAETFHIARRKEAIPLHAVGRYKAAAAFMVEQEKSQSRLRFCGDYLATATIDGAIATGFATAAQKTLG